MTLFCNYNDTETIRNAVPIGITDDSLYFAHKIYVSVYHIFFETRFQNKEKEKNNRHRLWLSLHKINHLWCACYLCLLPAFFVAIIKIVPFYGREFRFYCNQNEHIVYTHNILTPHANETGLLCLI